MKSNYWKFYKILLLIAALCINLTFGYSQINEDVKATKIKGKQSDEGDGKYTFSIRLALSTDGATSVV